MTEGSEAQKIMAVAIAEAMDHTFCFMEHHESGGGRPSPDGIALEALGAFTRVLQEKGLVIYSVGVHDVFCSIDADEVAEQAGDFDPEDFTGYSEIGSEQAPDDDTEKLMMVRDDDQFSAGS